MDPNQGRLPAAELLDKVRRKKPSFFPSEVESDG